MNYTIAIPDPDIPAFSAQFESRSPILRNAAGDVIEAVGDHVARALGVWVNQELDAARKIAADAVIEDAKNDAERSSALLAADKLRAGETIGVPATATR